MSAKKKAIIAIVVGLVLGVALSVFLCVSYYSEVGEEATEGILNVLPMLIMYIIAFPLYAFGFAFGWKKGKGIVAKMVGIAAEVTFFALIVHLIRGKGFMSGLIIAMLLVSLGFTIVWIMGIPIGIKEVWTESRATA